MRCCKCGEEIGNPKWYWIKYWDGKWEPICEWCAFYEKESAGRLRGCAGLDYVINKEVVK